MMWKILTVFDWVSPTVELVREGKRVTQGEKLEYSFKISDRDIGRAEAALQRKGISYRRTTYNFLAGNRWLVRIDPKDRDRARGEFRRLGVNVRE